MVLGQIVGELLVWGLGENCFLPQVWSEVTVGLGNGSIGCFSKVAQSGSLSASAGVAIINTSHVQQLLGNRGTDNSCSSWGRDESHNNAATLASDLARYCVGLANLVTPITATNRDDRKLSQDDSSTNSSSNFLGAFYPETNMTIEVSNGNESLESSSLTGTSLLLDRHNFENLILESRSQEEINDFKLLDGKREKIDIFKSLYFHVLHETSKLGDRNPFLVFLAATTSSSPTATTASVTVTTTSAGWCLVRHLVSFQ